MLTSSPLCSGFYRTMTAHIMKLVLSVSLIVILTHLFGACSRKESRPASKLSRTQVERISAAKKFEDLFEKTSEVELKQDSSCLIGTISALAITRNGTIIVGDNSAHRILVFDASGNFLRTIGNPGAGPGEFLRIAWLEADSRDNVLCLDNKLDRVTRFDLFGNPLLICRVEYGFRLVSNDDGGFLVYNYIAHPNSSQSILFLYDSTGSLRKKFGSPFLKVIVGQVPISGGSISTYENKIFAVQASEFSVRMMSFEGETIKEFMRNSPIYKPIEPPLTFLDKEKLDSFTATASVFAIPPGVVCVTLMRNNLMQSWLEVFDTDGNFLTGAIEIPSDLESCRTKHNGMLYFMKKLPKHVDSTGNIPNPRIVGFRIRE